MGAAKRRKAYRSAAAVWGPECTPILCLLHLRSTQLAAANVVLHYQRSSRSSNMGTAASCRWHCISCGACRYAPCRNTACPCLHRRTCTFCTSPYCAAAATAATASPSACCSCGSVMRFTTMTCSQQQRQAAGIGAAQRYVCTPSIQHRVGKHLQACEATAIAAHLRSMLAAAAGAMPASPHCCCYPMYTELATVYHQQATRVALPP